MKASTGGKIMIVRRLLEGHRNVRRCIEWLGMACMSFVVFFPRMLQVGYEWPQFFHSMCLNFGRSFFPFAILLVVLPSILGIRHTFIRTLLDTPIFNFLARISYGVYLVHGLVILYIANTKRYDTYFWITDLYVNSLTVILISCLFGLVLTLFAELPLAYATNKLLRALGGQEQSGVVVGGRKEGAMRDGEKKRMVGSTETESLLESIG
jgi:peptidoglycan/LPS O-acetylase OafA/YrhL